MTQAITGRDERMAWFREARFGMMITWGIYALEAAGEWVQYKRRTPIREYEKLAAHFNPVKFNAGEWVSCAKQAGMKYMVAMAKHHDGFCMFPSEVSPYNLIDATPWKHDFLKELADACRSEGLHFGLYYSHIREWHHPDASSLEPHSATHFGNYGNFWDFPHEERKNLQTFLDEVSLPQLREVLERYQPDLLWFDTPSLIRPDQAAMFYNLVRSICPECLINSRIGKTAAWDYLSCGDNEIPETDGVDFETPMVMNGAWGYNTSPEKMYLPASKYISDMIAIAARGGNYLLNVGPDPSGCFQEDAVRRLKEVGAWLGLNGEAIYGTSAVDLPEPVWGRITAKPGPRILYLFVQQWQPEIVLRGLESAVSACTFLVNGEPVPFTRRAFSDLTNELVLSLPATSPDPVAAVIRVDLAEPLRVCADLIEDERNVILFKASKGVLERGPDSRAAVNHRNTIEFWYDDDICISWEFVAAFNGDYTVEVELKTDFFGEWDSGYSIHAACADQHASSRFHVAEGYVSRLCSYERKSIELGVFALARGRHTLTLSASDVAPNLKTRYGVSLTGARLVRRLNGQVDAAINAP